MSAPAVVITGAVAGIGRAIALRLLAAGWAVVAVDLDADGLAALEREQAGAGLVGVAGDVAEPWTLERAAAVARERFGRLDAWVNNAGVPTEGPFEQETLERLDRTLAVNLRAPLLGCQVAVKAFLESGTAGAIVNVSSIHARAGFPGWIAYDAAKGGIDALTRSVCVEFGARGIRCNAVAPGAVLTAATGRVLAAAEDREALQRQWRELSPMGVVLTPDDVAAAVAYLLSADARFVNGHVLAVDAGMAARCVALPPPR
ncbi:SDR family oxidoreductase [Conexibacter sp. JD483]|uniref:SDR family NAD(P)-dependent oxidoreductase n=1 Tax=unclassified Conexibacter TaxID=2627773 RepID=UPI00271BD506|nr:MULTISPECIES: SDR family oxidoreductase [unclassified Conexibacter]MDO8189491.1 SDR family oxidoreductase [Conexibacter sp. CPCC 205706]MDO8202081.1 SDR family oxidoreductase [Conexibacter sp. CPCC 205762]MDR9372717.1 SDR family oxidoreductase [Conexibacter sp. JD483]